MAAILSFPFRLNGNGTVATVEQGSDQANAEQLAVLLTTIQGERPLALGFGLPDPAFSGIAPGVISAQVAKWGPNVSLASITVVPASQLQSNVTIEFS